MDKKFIPYFRDPLDKRALSFFEFESAGNNLLTGLFINESSGSCYPLLSGVPVFLPKSIPVEFIKKHYDGISKFKEKYANAEILSSNASVNWSFSSEWEAHQAENMDTTWGMTREGRYEQFLLEVETSETEIKDKALLDAGCGNGMLTEYLSTKGLLTFGIDYSNSVFAAEANRKSESVCFLRGDLQQPPFADETFDFIVSNGVLHHTPKTEETFHRLSFAVKKQGRFFIWLYDRRGSFGWRLKRRLFDGMRMLVSRMPSGIQKAIVGVFTGILFSLYKLTGRKLDYQTLRVDMFDSLTPRWRHYHTPLEVSRWYFENGFGPVRLTHWDNRYGFGVYAVKSPVGKPPGERYKVK